MRLDNKLKQATLTVALRYILKNKDKCKERACRNMIELGNDLSGDTFSKEILIELYEALLKQIDRCNELEIKEWLIKVFNLS